MIEYIKGKLVSKGNPIVIEVGGVGIGIFMSELDKSKLPENGATCEIFTVLKFQRDDIPQIYGFGDFAAKEIFKILISVSGIGPKASLAILNKFSVGEIVGAIRREDASLFASVSGIGIKSARRIVVDLKDKVERLAISPEESSYKPFITEAIDALVALGFQVFMARKVVEEVLKEAPDISRAEEIVAEALPRLKKNQL